MVKGAKMKREHIKSFIIGNKKRKYIEVVYYKNIFNILSISIIKKYRTLKRLYDKDLTKWLY